MKPVPYITGYGIYSCLGTNVDAVEYNLRKGKRGYGYDALRNEIGYHSALTGIVPTPSRPLTMSPRQWRHHSQSAQYAYYAVAEMLNRTPMTEDERKACAVIAASDSSALAMAQTLDKARTEGNTRCLGATKVLADTASSPSLNIAHGFGLHGPSLTVSAACASGLQAVSVAKMLIETGACEDVIVIGTQEVNEIFTMSFDAIGIFSQKGSNPFSKEADGIVPSGGAAAILISARRRHDNDPIIRGFHSNTSSNLASSDADSEEECMHRANPYPWAVDVCFAHATGTRQGDEAEETAILRTLGRGQRVQMMKALTGHEISMSGVSTIVYALIQREGGFLAKTMFGTPRTSFLKFTHETTALDFKTMQINAFGLGGVNASILIG